MPVHDWTRVSAGTFHDFHTVWMGAIRTALNDGLLPADYYALCEQDASDVGPDVLTLRSTTEIDRYALKQRKLVIRHSSGDRIIALVEILSPGNKSSRQAFRAFLEKAVAALAQGYHLLLVDLQPPTKRDPQGIHGALWSEICDDSCVAPSDKPLTLAGYSAGLLKKAYVNPIAVGDTLPDMPLFLTSANYVSVPLEATYLDAWRGVPKRWRSVLEAPPG